MLLACALYAWQVAVTWAGQNRVDPSEAGTRILDPAHPDQSIITVNLLGEGIAEGATGRLTFDDRGARGTLEMANMPVLPSGQVYQMWCVDEVGRADVPIIFRVAAGDREDSSIKLSTPRMLYGYVRFYITVEPAGGSSTPSGPVVMENG